MGPEKRAEWEKRIAKWKASGLTAKQFAAETGINARTLGWYQWQLHLETRTRALAPHKDRASAKTTMISPVTFVEMTASVAGEPLEVVLRSRVCVRVRPGFDSPTLKRLLDVLESRH